MISWRSTFVASILKKYLNFVILLPILPLLLSQRHCFDVSGRYQHIVTTNLRQQWSAFNLLKSVHLCGHFFVQRIIFISVPAQQPSHFTQQIHSDTMKLRELVIFYSQCPPLNYMVQLGMKSMKINLNGFQHLFTHSIEQQ